MHDDTSSTRSSVLCAIALAQVLSVALATTGVSSQSLANQGVHAPTLQAFCNYCLLAFVFGLSSILLPHIQQRQPSQLARLRRSWPSFAALALIDVEANVLVTKAYQYSSLTSVTLLDCFTVPCVMVLSWLLLGARFKGRHYTGAVCCIAGLAVLVLGDSSHGTSSSSSSSGPAPLLGDSLVLLGALLYAVCNVTQELLLSDVQPGQLLALLGFFGTVISGAQAALLEHAMIASVRWAAASVLLPMAGFTAAMFVFYSLVPRVLQLGGATTLNLSLLTSDAWAALARYLWFGGFDGSSAYFFGASVLLVGGGLAVFTLGGSPKSSAADSSSRDGGAGPSSSSAQAAAAPLGQHVAYSRLQAAGDVEDQQQPACQQQAAAVVPRT